MRYATGLTIALLLVPLPAAAEWQFKPFVGFTFAPSTTLLGDIEFAADRPIELEIESGSSNIAFGVGVVLLGEVFGVEADWANAPGFFQARDQDKLQSSGAQTFTGSLVVAVPRGIAQYSLRPYLVAGAGVMRLRAETAQVGGSELFPIRETLAAIDLGGGATGFFNERVGVAWDLRYIRSVAGESGDPLVTIDGLAKQLSFWRANMALVLRY